MKKSIQRIFIAATLIFVAAFCLLIAKMDFHVAWDELKIAKLRTIPDGIDFEFSFRNLCLSRAKPARKFCFDNLFASGQLTFKRFLHPDLVLDEVTARSKFKNSYQQTGKHAGGKSLYEWATLTRRIVSKLPPMRLAHIQIDSFELRNLTQSYFMSFDLKTKNDRADLSYAIYREDKFRVELGAQVSLAGITGAGDIGGVQGNISSDKFKLILPPSKLYWKENSLIIDASATAFLPSKIQIAGQGNILLNSQALVANLVLNSTHPKIKKIKPILASVIVPQQQSMLWAQKKSTLKVLGWLPSADVPVEINGEADLKNYFLGANGPLAQLQVKLKPRRNNLYYLRAQGEFTLSREGGRFEVSPQINAHLTTEHFKSFGRHIENEKIFIPAPFTHLDGVLDFKTKGYIKKTSRAWRLPIQIQTNLKDGSQVINAKASGAIEIPFDFIGMNITGDILLRDVAIALPHIDPAFGLPALKKDPRIKIASGKKKSRFPITYAINVKTENKNSMRILYNLTAPYVPIDLNLHIQNGSMPRGYIALSEFLIDYLNRESTVENFSFRFAGKTVGLNGLIRFDRFPYKIYVETSGNLKSPRFKFRAEPYLDLANIVSMLLYNRPRDEIYEADAEIVGNFSEAIEKNAVGIIGLVAFSHTPIQSFYYNELTNLYTAQLEVGEGTTLNFGITSENERSAELVKRISANWTVNASINPEDAEEKPPSFRLQWQNRF